MSGAVLFGLLAALGYGGTDFVAPIASRAVGIVRALFYSQAVALVLISLWLLLEPGLHDILAHAPAGAWAAAAGSSLLVLLATASLFQGLTHGTLAVVAPVTASYGVVTALLSGFAGEQLSALTIGGMAATVAGVLLVSAPDRASRAIPRQDRKSSGLGWALASAFGYGVGFWLQGAGAVPALGAIVPVWVYYVLGVVGLAVLSRPLGQSLALPEARHRPVIFGLGLLSAGANGAMTLGLETQQIAIVTVLSSLASAVTVLLARFLLKHPVAGHQWAGLASIVGGLALIHGST